MLDTLVSDLYTYDFSNQLEMTSYFLIVFSLCFVIKHYVNINPQIQYKSNIYSVAIQKLELLHTCPHRFNSKMTSSNYSDICSLYHSNYSNPKFYIRLSPKIYHAGKGFIL